MFFIHLTSDWRTLCHLMLYFLLAKLILFLTCTHHSWSIIYRRNNHKPKRGMMKTTYWRDRGGAGEEGGEPEINNHLYQGRNGPLTWWEYKRKRPHRLLLQKNQGINMGWHYTSYTEQDTCNQAFLGKWLPRFGVEKE